ncbi:uncharacterized protein LOC111710003 [Eurytemora carolleeae]|uniref:uncharacterized protein LOC111710003 n=1 Tax=Eurytemora carolleeae TaxID=1294199 RepID=UPI000C7626F3|nr:uncharacterized protein LOC111710003 [Eurytemora carolleeae]|eukprot:XP_023339766.1 uncharacterized protein LOC111710003 [Eurytemora affinis]
MFRDDKGYQSDHNTRNPPCHQDSIRSGYMSDHELRISYDRSRIGPISKSSEAVHQQMSIESMPSSDSRLCYLTSSELRSQEKKHQNVCECKLMGCKCGNENISYNVKIRIGSDSEVCFQNPPPDVVNCR